MALLALPPFLSYPSSLHHSDRSTLLEYGVSDEICALIVQGYCAQRDSLVNYLEKSGSPGKGIPEIVDIDWRLDYCLNSRNTSAATPTPPLPRFFITLTVRDFATLREVQMIASEEELQDLLTKISDGIKQVDRLIT
jgi:hypothetical protein